MLSLDFASADILYVMKLVRLLLAQLYRLYTCQQCGSCVKGSKVIFFSELPYSLMYSKFFLGIYFFSGLEDVNTYIANPFWKEAGECSVNWTLSLMVKEIDSSFWSCVYCLDRPDCAFKKKVDLFYTLQYAAVLHSSNSCDPWITDTSSWQKINHIWR